RFHGWAERPRPRRIGDRDLLERYEKITDFDGIRASVFDASQRKIRLHQDDLQLRNVQVVQAEVAVKFRFAVRVIEVFGGTHHLISASDRNAGRGTLAEVNITSVCRQYPSGGIELRNNPQVLWIMNLPYDARAIQIIKLDLAHWFRYFENH